MEGPTWGGSLEIINRRSLATFGVFSQSYILLFLELLSWVTVMFNVEFSKGRAHPCFDGLLSLCIFEVMGVNTLDNIKPPFEVGI